MMIIKEKLQYVKLSTDCSVERFLKVKSFISDTVAVIEYNGSEYYLLSYQGNFAD